MEMTLTFPASRQGSNPLRLIALLALAILAIAISYEASHALDKHRTAAAVQKCLDQNGPAMVFRMDNRYIRVCEVAPGEYGLQVLDDIGGQLEEKTAYIRGKLQSVLNGMKNLGAVKIWDAASGEPLPEILR